MPDSRQFIVFELSGQRYGLPVEEVAEVIRMVEVDHLPKSPDWMLGVINLRGEIIPVADLRVRMGVEASPLSLTTPILITRDQGSGRMGLVADSVDDMIDIDEEKIDPLADDSDRTAVARIDEGLVLIVNLPAILIDAEEAMRGR